MRACVQNNMGKGWDYHQREAALLEDVLAHPQWEVHWETDVQPPAATHYCPDCAVRWRDEPRTWSKCWVCGVEVISGPTVPYGAGFGPTWPSTHTEYQRPAGVSDSDHCTCDDPTVVLVAMHLADGRELIEASRIVYGRAA